MIELGGNERSPPGFFTLRYRPSPRNPHQGRMTTEQLTRSTSQEALAVPNNELCTFGSIAIVEHMLMHYVGEIEFSAERLGLAALRVGLTTFFQISSNEPAAQPAQLI